MSKKEKQMNNIEIIGATLMLTGFVLAIFGAIIVAIARNY